MIESNPVFKSSSIFRNSAAEMGGGISLVYSTPVFDTDFRNNIYANHAGYSGNDLFADHDQIISVPLDSFTLASPDA